MAERLKRNEGLRTRRATLQNDGLDMTKLPPQATEIEEAVLGALLIDNSAFSTVGDLLRPESFYVEAHQKIFEAIRALHNKHKVIDILTVTNELKVMGYLEMVGGAFAVASLSGRVASAAHVEFHARIVAEKFILRELIRVSTGVIKDAYEGQKDVLELLDEAESGIFHIAESNIGKEVQSMDRLILEAIKGIEEASKITTGISGVPSGFKDIDAVTGGWQKSDLIIIAARPGMGKTAFVLSMARNIAVDFKIPIAFFSLEMSSVQLVNRLISGETELNADKLKRGNLQPYEWQQLQTKITPLTEAPIYFDDTAGINILNLRSKVRRLKAEKNIGMVIIDYLQLVTAGSEGRGTREQDVGMISRSLKGIAKELQIPIIVLSQLNRSVEYRDTAKMPQLSDLRESGSIEQDADMVCFIYRPDYYKLDKDAAGNDVEGLAVFSIKKHRNGALEDINIRFVKERAKFMDFSTSITGIYDALASGRPPEQGSLPSITIHSKMNQLSEDDPGLPGDPFGGLQGDTSIPPPF